MFGLYKNADLDMRVARRRISASDRMKLLDTREGLRDSQSLLGKVVIGVARRAAALGNLSSQFWAAQTAAPKPPGPKASRRSFQQTACPRTAPL